MKRITGLLLVLVGILAMCTGCGSLESGNSANTSLQASEADSDGAAQSEGEISISLQGDLESGTLEVVVTWDGETSTYSTPTLNGLEGEELSAPEVELFSDIMGHVGFCEIHPRAGSSWSERYYYAIDMDGEDEPVCIAESYGFTQDDYSADLDGDGVTELICNCSYTSIETEEVLVYREADGSILQSTVNKGSVLSEEDNPTDAVLLASYGLFSYDGEQGLFLVRYPDATGNWLEKQVTWPEDFTETVYEPSYTVVLSSEES